jgi:hypothetical protein
MDYSDDDTFTSLQTRLMNRTLHNFRRPEKQLTVGLPAEPSGSQTPMWSEPADLTIPAWDPSSGTPEWIADVESVIPPPGKSASIM